jgi:hypothetical protein
MDAIMTSDCTARMLEDKYYYHIVMEPWLNGDTIIGNS